MPILIFLCFLFSSYEPVQDIQMDLCMGKMCSVAYMRLRNKNLAKILPKNFYRVVHMLKIGGGYV